MDVLSCCVAVPWLVFLRCQVHYGGRGITHNLNDSQIQNPDKAWAQQRRDYGVGTGHVTEETNDA